MAKSESRTQEWTLASVETGAQVDVVAVLADDPAILLVHGIRAGARLTIQDDGPLGGPRIVRMGSRRVAVDRRLARSVVVMRVADPAAAQDRDRR